MGIKILKNIQKSIINKIDYSDLILTFLGIAIFLNILLSYTYLSLSNLSIFIILFVAILILSIMMYKTKFIFSKQTVRLNRYFYFALILVCILTYRYISVFLFDAHPILHDPIAHSVWTKSIIDSGSINYFYSPGLHIFAGILFKIFGGLFEVPIFIQLISTLSYVLIPIFLSLSIAKLLAEHLGLKEITSFVFSLCLISLVDFPGYFYYTAGKNALVLAILIVPFIAYYTLKKEFKLKDLFFLALSYLILFFIHYPTFGIFFLIFAPFILYRIYKWGRAKKWMRLLWTTIFFLISTFITFGWFFPLLELRQTTQVENTPEANIELFNKLQTNFVLLESFLPINYESLEQTSILIIMLLILIASFKIIDKNKLFGIGALWGVLSPALLWLFIAIFEVNSLKILQLTIQIIYPYFLFIIFIIGSVIFIQKYISVKREQTLLLIIFACFVLIYSLGINSDHVEGNKGRDVIDNTDEATFTFIENNLEKNEVILNSVKFDEGRDIYFTTDGGGWIEAYTNQKPLFSFLNFSNNDSNEENYKYLKMLDKQETADEGLNFFINKGISYIYLDLPVFGPAVNVSHVMDRLEVMYSNERVVLYRIIK